MTAPYYGPMNAAHPSGSDLPSTGMIAATDFCDDGNGYIRDFIPGGGAWGMDGAHTLGGVAGLRGNGTSCNGVNNTMTNWAFPAGVVSVSVVFTLRETPTADGFAMLAPFAGQTIYMDTNGHFLYGVSGASGMPESGSNSHYIGIAPGRHIIVFTHSATEYWLYLDGNLVDHGTGCTFPAVASNYCRFNGLAPLKINWEEFIAWNRTLTASEIQTHHLALLYPPWGFSQPRLTLAIGDSITVINGVNSYPSKVKSYLGGYVINHGVAGNTIPNLIVRYENDVLLYEPDLIMLLAGINSIETGESLADIKSGILTLLNNGHRTVIGTITPVNAWNETQNALLVTVNAWIKTLAGGRVAVADYNAAVRDGTDPTNWATGLDNGDGVHPSVAGSQRIADTAYAAIHAAGWDRTVNKWLASEDGTASDPTKWSLNRIPQAGDDIIIGRGGSCTWDLGDLGVVLSPDYDGTLDCTGRAITLPEGVFLGSSSGIVFGSKVLSYGNTDTSAGSADFGTSQYVQAGPGTIKLGTGQALNDVEAPVVGLNLASDVTINGKYRHLRAATLNGFALTYDPSKEIKMTEDGRNMAMRQMRMAAMVGGAT